MLKIVSVLALLIVMISLVSSQDEVQPASPEFKCYVCNSLEDSSCAGENGKYAGVESHKKVCDSGVINCRIITQNGKPFFFKGNFKSLNYKLYFFI